MKNIHLLPTENPSRLFKDDFGRLIYSINIDQEQNHFEPQNLYITSDEEIKEGDWYFITESISKCESKYEANDLTDTCKRIILTTDKYLIKDGVQAVDDEFLEWFVKNTSCEEVEIDKNWNYPLDKSWEYKIIIPKEEPKPIHQQIIDVIGGEDRFREIAKIKPKQETIEEAAENYARKQCDDMYDDIAPSGGSWGWETSTDFIEGAKWQQERMYSEEEVYQLLYDLSAQVLNNKISTPKLLEKWFEQFKKKQQ